MCDLHPQDLLIFETNEAHNLTHGGICLLCIAHDAFPEHDEVPHGQSAMALQELVLGLQTFSREANTLAPQTLGGLVELLQSLAHPVCVRILESRIQSEDGDRLVRLVKVSTSILLSISQEDRIAPLNLIARDALHLWASCCCQMFSPDHEETRQTLDRTIPLQAILACFAELRSGMDEQATIFTPWFVRLLEVSEITHEQQAGWQLAAVILEDAAMMSCPSNKSLSSMLTETFCRFPECLLVGVIRAPQPGFVCVRQVLDYAVHGDASSSFSHDLFEYLVSHVDSLIRGLSLAGGAHIVSVVKDLLTLGSMALSLVDALAVFVIHHMLVVNTAGPGPIEFDVLNGLINVMKPETIQAIPLRTLNQIVLGTIQQLERGFEEDAGKGIHTEDPDRRVLYRLVERVTETVVAIPQSIRVTLAEFVQKHPDPDALGVLVAIIGHLQLPETLNCLSALQIMIRAIPREIRLASDVLLSLISKAIREGLSLETMEMCVQTLLEDFFERVDHLLLVTDEFHRCVIALLSTTTAGLSNDSPIMSLRYRLALHLQQMGYLAVSLDWFKGNAVLIRQAFAVVLRTLGFALSVADSSAMIGLDLTLGSNWMRHLDRVGSSSSFLVVWAICFRRHPRSTFEHTVMADGLLRWLAQSYLNSPLVQAKTFDLMTDDNRLVMDDGEYAVAFEHNDEDGLGDEDNDENDREGMTDIEWITWLSLYSHLASQSNPPKRLVATLSKTWRRRLSRQRRDIVIQGLINLVATKTSLSQKLRVMRVIMDLTSIHAAVEGSLEQVNDEYVDDDDDDDDQGQQLSFWSATDLADMMTASSSTSDEIDSRDEETLQMVVKQVFDPESIHTGLDLEKMLLLKEAMIEALVHRVDSIRITETSLSRWIMILSWLVCLDFQPTDIHADPSLLLIHRLASICVSYSPGIHLSPYASKRVLDAGIGEDDANQLETRACLLRLVSPELLQHHREPLGLCARVLERLVGATASSVRRGDLLWVQTALELQILNTGKGDSLEMFWRAMIPILTHQGLGSNGETEIACIRALAAVIKLMQTEPRTSHRTTIDILHERAFMAGVQLLVLRKDDGDDVVRRDATRLLQTISLSSLASDDSAARVSETEGYVSTWLESYVAEEMQRFAEASQKIPLGMVQLLAFTVLMRGPEWPWGGDDGLYDELWQKAVQPLLLEWDWYEETHVVPTLLIALLVVFQVHSQERLRQTLESRLLGVQRSFSLGAAADGHHPQDCDDLARVRRAVLTAAKSTTKCWNLNRTFASHFLELVFSVSRSSPSSTPTMSPRPRVLGLVDLVLTVIKLFS